MKLRKPKILSCLNKVNMLFRTFIIIYLLLGAIQVKSQSKKDIQKYKITSVTVVNTKGEASYTDESQKFDKNGNTIEEINYKTDGTLKEKIVRKYDKNNNLIIEELYDEKGLKEKTAYAYNPLGEKTTEQVFNPAGKLIKKSNYDYNNKGLKSEKKVYDGTGNMISVKKYKYASE